MWSFVSFGKTVAETVTMLKETCKDEDKVKTSMSGLIISKEVKCLLKTSYVVAAFPQAELAKMLKKFTRLSCCQTIDKIYEIMGM